MISSLMTISLTARADLVDTSVTCPDSTPESGFTDIGDQAATTQLAINCLVSYGVTKGTSATTYSPNNPVPRWQMALFLTRTLSAAGETLPDGSDQGFTDIGDLSAESQTAINQLAQLGVTKGTTATTFSPNLNVTRVQMALFIARMHEAAGTTLGDGSDQGFTDIGDLSADAQTRINQLVQIGDANGTSATTFSPKADTLRWHMALFLTRALAVEGVVPIGLTLVASTTSAFTSNGVTLTVTFKDENGALVEGQRVDVFVASSFNSNGTANLDGGANLDIAGDAGTGTDATIDALDPQTNSNGEIVLELTHSDVAATDSVVAWIGAIGDVFNQNTVASTDMRIVGITWSLGPANLVLPANRLAHFGTATSTTAQLVDTNGDPVALAGATIHFSVQRGGSAVLVENVATDATGAATLTYTGPADPSANNDAGVVDTVTAFWDKNGDGADNGTAEFDDTQTLTWEDDP
ncbi:MAG TPA: S-layer homology domain-containing protein, partial [Acidimicrobiia bacterium]|nr:S-layer homology domain-containing protein [Acidimicrobiia bacterium]